MKSFIVILFIIGLITMFVGYVEEKKNCPETKIEYRYIPRSFYEEQVSNTNLKNLYSDIFDKPSIWSSYPFRSSSNKNKNYDNLFKTDN